jgi:hypothetical protein
MIREFSAAASRGLAFSFAPLASDDPMSGGIQ